VSLGFCGHSVYMNLYCSNTFVLLILVIKVDVVCCHLTCILLSDLSDVGRWQTIKFVKCTNWVGSVVRTLCEFEYTQGSFVIFWVHWSIRFLFVVAFFYFHDYCTRVLYFYQEFYHQGLLKLCGFVLCRFDTYFPTRLEHWQEMSWNFENAALLELFMGMTDF